MRFLTVVLLTATLGFAAGEELTQPQIDEIIRKFAAKEGEFAKAREVYTYRQTARLQELDGGGNVTGRWEEVADIVFEQRGKRTERVVRAPVSTLKQIVMTPEDLKDMRDVQPFVLTTEHIPDYHIRYLGKETLDEIPCHAFAVKPKEMKQGERYFSGIVWVDDRDLQVVKTYGRAAGIAKGQQFPKFETYREQIDGVFWFPTYTIAEDTLHFENSDVRIRQTIKYEDYKRFGAESTIIFDESVIDDPVPPPPPPAPAKP